MDRGKSNANRFRLELERKIKLVRRESNDNVFPLSLRTFRAQNWTFSMDTQVCRSHMISNRRNRFTVIKITRRFIEFENQFRCRKIESEANSSATNDLRVVDLVFLCPIACIAGINNSIVVLCFMVIKKTKKSIREVFRGN